MVYVLSRTGKALMPTQRYGKVRRLLRDGLAVVVRREPFTIRLTYDTTEFTQPVTLGVDAGTKHVGLSATTETRELFVAEKTSPSFRGKKVDIYYKQFKNNKLITC